MTRPIKFRAWDSVLGMKPVIVLAGDGAWWKVTTDVSTYTLNNGVLMQSTGLRDRNGVEIYEGDIVRQYIPETEPDSGEFEQTFTVVFDGGSFCIDSDGLPLGMFEAETFEILGNVHEPNPTKN